MKKLVIKILKLFYQIILKGESKFDGRYFDKDILSGKINHERWQGYLSELANKEGMRILEVGSREVTSTSDARKIFSKASYTGFDLYPGPNVDVVGDAHRLSSYFNAGEKFDLIYSSACFEHFAMPWQVAKEISKLLKVNGLVFVETHFSFSTHERPWHFFHFTDMGLKVLFSKAMGFECIEAGFSNPVVGRFSSLAAKYLVNRPVAGLYCHTEFLGRKIKDVENFYWENADITDLTDGTRYPAPKKEASHL